MEHHGKNHPKNGVIVIPARYESTRLPGKLLLELCGKPLILHTAERASKAVCARSILVATDDERIARVVENAGFDCVMTSREHQTGSDRIVEAVSELVDDEIVVNVQGDEPLISPSTIDAAFDALATDETSSMSTTCERISDARDVLSPDVVKVVVDSDRNALYFSRSPIPFPRDAVRKFGSLVEALAGDPQLIGHFRKHTGLYAYRCSALRRFSKISASSLERCETLEQLRGLENGLRIKVVEVAESSIGVDTPEDFERVKRIVEGANV